MHEFGTRMDVDHAKIRADLDRGELPDRYVWSSLHQSVRSRDVEATFTLAYHYYRIHGQLALLTRDWFVTAAELGHPLAPRFLAEIDEASCRKREQLRLQAEAGEVGAQVELAEILLRTQDNLGHDWEAARHWFQLAAEQGNPRAQSNFGSMLLDGKGGPADPIQGVYWLEQAFAVGETWIARALAALYEVGEVGIPKDPERAAYWRSQAETLKDAQVNPRRL